MFAKLYGLYVIDLRIPAKRMITLRRKGGTIQVEPGPATSSSDSRSQPFDELSDLVSATATGAHPSVDFVPGNRSGRVGIAGDQVEVEVGNAGADDRRVHPLRATRFSQRSCKPGSRATDRGAFVVAQVTEAGDVTVRHDQQVAEIWAAALVERRQVEGGDRPIAQEKAARNCHVAAKLTAHQAFVLHDAER